MVNGSVDIKGVKTSALEKTIANSYAILKKGAALEAAAIKQEEFNKKYTKFLAENKQMLSGKRASD